MATQSLRSTGPLGPMIAGLPGDRPMGPRLQCDREISHSAF